MSNENDYIILYAIPSEVDEAAKEELGTVEFCSDAIALDDKPYHIFTPAGLAAMKERIAAEAFEAGPSTLQRTFNNWWMQRLGK